MKIEDLKNVPNKPGVYLWKDQYDSVVYIGKAKKLQTRLKQYIKGSINSYKTQKMMQKVKSFDYVLSTSEKEALVLERNLINKYKPIFNIKLTDDKKYPYIKAHLRRDGLKISLSYKTKEHGPNIMYFGPFPSGYGAKKMCDFLNREFVFKDGLPYSSNNINYWQNQFSALKQTMSKDKALIRILREKMDFAAEKQQYEIAQDIKETIKAIITSAEIQVAEIKDTMDIDVLVFFEKSGYLSIEQMFYRQGILLVNKKSIIEITHSLKESVRQFVSQYYEINLKPSLIVSNMELECPIKSIIPVKGIKKQILDIALQNAEDNIQHKLEKYIRKEELTIGAINKLKKLLKMSKLDHIIMVDDSTFANANPVSVFVSYRNGIKNRKEYRKYKVEPNERKSDVEYMRQGVIKFFGNSQNPIPDLLIVDGGIQQVNEIKKLVPKINIIGLVKNQKHQTEAIVTKKGKKLTIEDQALYNFLSGIQTEVDRYAKNFYNKRAKITTLEGKIKSLKGVGEKTEQKLLNHFHSYSAIYNASIEELAKVVGLELAKIIERGLKQ